MIPGRFDLTAPWPVPTMSERADRQNGGECSVRKTKGETVKKHITARDAETLITLKLRELNAQILLAEDGTLKATTPQGQTLTIISLLPEEGSKAKFVLPEFQDRPHRFIVCTEQDETGAPSSGSSQRCVSPTGEWPGRIEQPKST